MAEASENWDEEDSVISILKNCSIQKTRLQQLDGNSEERTATGRTFVELPCGHRRPAHYIIAWFKYYLKQREPEFSCPAFNERRRRSCGLKLSYPSVCRLMSSKQRQILEEKWKL